MLVPLTVLSVSLVWILLVSILARTQFPNRFLTKPHLGLAIWFTALTSSFVASVSGILGLGAAYLYSVERASFADFGDSDWLLGFAWSFVPWVLLAGFGVLLALINLRIETPIIASRRLEHDFQLAKRDMPPFEGVSVSSIPLPIHYALATKNEIILSQFTIDQLSEEQLQAVLWHELGHIKGNHQTLKRIAGLVALLTKPMSISRVFNDSVEVLCEESADNFARRFCSPETVNSVRVLMRGSN